MKTFQIDLLAQDAQRVTVQIELLPAPAQLPFRIDAAACARELREVLMAAGVTARSAPTGTALLLEVPGCAEGTLNWSSRDLHGPT